MNPNVADQDFFQESFIKSWPELKEYNKFKTKPSSEIKIFWNNLLHKPYLDSRTMRKSAFIKKPELNLRIYILNNIYIENDKSKVLNG